MDEAHATGVLGPQGQRAGRRCAARRAIGLGHHPSLRQSACRHGRVCLLLGELKQYLVNRARTFIFSTALPPYMAAQMRAASNRGRRRCASEPISPLWRAFLRGKIAAMRVLPPGGAIRKSCPLCSVTMNAPCSLRRRSTQAGFGVRAIRPPTVPAGTSRLRLSLTASMRLHMLAALRGDAHCHPRASHVRRSAAVRAMSSNFFITGTDTNVGKTLLSALLVAALDGIYWKPIQTGALKAPIAKPSCSWRKCPGPRTLPECYCFDPPVSPHLAAEDGGVCIDLARIQCSGAHLGQARSSWKAPAAFSCRSTIRKRCWIWLRSSDCPW